MPVPACVPAVVPIPVPVESPAVSVLAGDIVISPVNPHLALLTASNDDTEGDDDEDIHDDDITVGGVTLARDEQ